jgi:hypothetical protein
MNRSLSLSRLFYLLLFQTVLMLPLQAENQEQFVNQVNLALRQAGHELLQAQKDSTTAIPPIRQSGSGEFLLQIENSFDYDLLPSLIKKAFEDYEISQPYNVLVKSCDGDTIILGYNWAALERGNTPCQGREQSDHCAKVAVTFLEKTNNKEEQKTAFAWLILPLLTVLGFLVFRRIGSKPPEEKNDALIALGQYSFDPGNQLLTIGEEKSTLTYRENKLLRLFAHHPNEVLERAQIMSSVWEDEGVVVGRSLDVFVSRLRKLLKKDPAVQIKNIHGVGYRLELP